jgi:FPC/CPF motif-containing protein YcgG
MSDDANMNAMSTALKQYLEIPPSELGPNTSLAVLFPTSSSPLSVQEYYQKYWDCLRGLRARDPQSWPDHIPTEIDTPMWRLCFNGQPIFSAALTPAHTKRRSRYAPCFCIVFQPNFVFDILFSTQLKKQSAISRVRGLLSEFDDVAVSPELKNYGDETGREFKQYFILDENKAPLCPYATLG